jgi:hypothetical protein
VDTFASPSTSRSAQRPANATTCTVQPGSGSSRG